MHNLQQDHLQWLLKSVISWADAEYLKCDLETCIFNKHSIWSLCSWNFKKHSLRFYSRILLLEASKCIEKMFKLGRIFLIFNAKIIEIWLLPGVFLLNEWLHWNAFVYGYKRALIYILMQHVTTPHVWIILPAKASIAFLEEIKC